MRNQDNSLGIFEVDRRTLKLDPAKEGALEEGRFVVRPAEWWSRFSQAEISAFCSEHGIYSVPTTELVDWLRERIAGRKAIEVGSGRGDLCAALGIPGTDSKMQNKEEIKELYRHMGTATVRYGEHVKPMDAIGAVRALKPQVVIATWLTHRYLDSESWRGGNALGVREEKIIAASEYIFVGNRNVHRHKPLLAYEHEEFEFPWLVSRALNGAPDFIAVWKKRAKKIEVAEIKYDQATSRLLEDLAATPPSFRRDEIVRRARRFVYHEYKSELAMPIAALVNDLAEAGFTHLAHNAANGRYDQGRDAAEEWAQTDEGKASISDLANHPEIEAGLMNAFEALCASGMMPKLEEELTKFVDSIPQKPTDRGRS